MKPIRDYLARMAAYLGEMYPVPRRLLTAALATAGFGTLLSRLHGLPAELGSRGQVLALVSVFGLGLILRLMDDLKDRDLDSALFPERPLPRGRVRETDLAGTLAAVMLLCLAAHVGAGMALASASLMLAYALLMFRHFFARNRLRASLPLTLATHTPIVPLLFLHQVVLFAVQRGTARLRLGPALAAVTLYWALVLAWEISRKIRGPQEETAYVTYSRILGPQRAVLLAVTAQVAALALGLLLALRFELAAAFPSLLGAGTLGALLAHARFLRRPGPDTSRLAPAAEANLACALVAGCLS